MAKVNYRKLTLEAINEVGASVTEGTKEFDAAVKYLTEYWEVAQDKQAAKDVGLKVKEYALNSIGNGIMDGNHLDYMVEDGEEDLPKGQEIIEVDQNSLKKALQTLVTRENDFLAYLYDMHAEYNERYFFGQLSHPFITIDKLSNKTLGNYTHGKDAMGITNHIRFNRNFIALNQGENGDDPTRILETLRHEMIHQWQDEVLYMKEGVAAHKITLPVGFGKFLDKNAPAIIKRTKDGKPIGETVDQKVRPKEWHNRDFKEYAVVVDIPAKGDKCYGNPAHMPEGKSYNRKFQCLCIASNDAPLTIWSTRAVNAVCQTCGSKFIEQKKAGGTIQVTLSHVELPGEDYMEKKMKSKGYKYFEKFGSKKEQNAFLDTLYATDVNSEGLDVEQGFYLRGNNAYKEGFTHWVAYNGVSEVFTKELPKEEAKKPAAKKPKAKKAVKPAPVAVEPPSEEPPVDPSPKKDDTKEKPKAKVPKAKKPAVKKPKAVEPAPQPEPEVEVPAEPEKEPDMTNVVQMPVKRDHKNPEHLLAAYKETGSIKGVAGVFGMTPANVIYWAKKLGVDFKKGEILDGIKS